MGPEGEEGTQGAISGSKQSEGKRKKKKTRTLGAPVVHQRNLLGHAQTDQVRKAQEEKQRRHEGQRAGRGVETACMRQPHALAEDVHQCLVGNGARAGQEEPGEGYVQDGYRGDDGAAGDESHGGGRWQNC